MNRNFTSLTVGVSLALGAFLVYSSQQTAQEASTGLPGARPPIIAAEFSSLQAAFDALPPEGGLVRLPAGTFEITETLVIKSEDVSIQGAGTATHIKNVNEEGKPALMIAHPGHKRAGSDRGHELWRMHLANFRLTGNEKSGHGIVAWNINEIYLDGITVSYHGGDGIRLNHCYEDPRISDSLITYNKGTGLHLQGCHDIVVAANQFEENNDALRCIDGYNLCMTGNCLDDHLGHGVVVENTYGSVVSGNMIEECKGTAIILDRDCYGDTVSANVIAHNGAGVDLRDAHGCTVSANTFTILKTDAVRIGRQSGRIVVSGNNFSNSYIGDGKVKRKPGDLAAAGLVLEETTAALVNGNIFSAVGPIAVKVSGDDNSSVLTNNLVIDANAGIPTEEIKKTVTQSNRSLNGQGKAGE